MSTFGTAFRVTTFGESHSDRVGVVVDGCPPRMPLSVDDIQPQLSRRRPGQSKITTNRNEADLVEICCGLEGGYTLGTPIMLMVKNRDVKKSDYSQFRDIPRPSHADFTYNEKYGINASSGGGRASARETIGRIAAGAIAEKWLSLKFRTEITAWVSAVNNVRLSKDYEAMNITRNVVDLTLVRCPCEEKAKEMQETIENAKLAKDSVGGIITCVCRNIPRGLGEPVFDKLKAKLAQAMLSIPATLGFEIGSGFEGTLMNGSEHNDLFIWKEGELRTASNNSGGVQGGISNGENIVFRVAFKPVSTIGVVQRSADYSGKTQVLEGKGRHDPCVLPRAVPIVESMASIVLMDASMIQLQRENCSSSFGVVGRAVNSSCD